MNKISFYGSFGKSFRHRFRNQTQKPSSRFRCNFLRKNNNNILLLCARVLFRMILYGWVLHKSWISVDRVHFLSSWFCFSSWFFRKIIYELKLYVFFRIHVRSNQYPKILCTTNWMIVKCVTHGTIYWICLQINCRMGLYKNLTHWRIYTQTYLIGNFRILWTRLGASMR